MKTLFVLLYVFFFQGISNDSLKNASFNTFKVRNLHISGNERTKTSIIEREFVLEYGDEVNVEKLQWACKQTKSNIVNTNLFLDSEVKYTIDNDFVDFFIEVEERWYWSILPNLTLADRSFNEWWHERGRDIKRLTYGVDVRHANLTGNADHLTINAHSGFVPLYRISYNKPYVDKAKKIGIAGALFFSSQKNLAFKTWEDKLKFISTNDFNLQRYGGGLTFRYRPQHNFFHTLSFNFTNNIVSDSVIQLNEEFFRDKNREMNLYSVDYEYRKDFRDVRQYPLKGNIFILRFSQDIALGGMHQTSILGNYTFFTPLKNRLFLENGFRTKLSFPKEQSYFLLSGLGYSGNVARGYELYVIDGQSFFLSKNTLKFKAYERKFNLQKLVKQRQFSKIPIVVYPNVYADYAFVKNFYPERSNSYLSNKHLLGYGFGLDIVTFYNINFRSYYSFNHLNEKKLYFGMSREF